MQTNFDFDAPPVTKPVTSRIVPMMASLMGRPTPTTPTPATDATDAPIIAKMGDIGADFAANAFHWTSFSPERRGEQRRQEYVAAVNGLYSELWTLATNDAQRTILAAEMERYRLGYIAHLSAYLASLARTASPMITGPANFPTRRNEKRNATCDKRAAELTAWDERARRTIKRKLTAAASPEEQHDAEWEPIRLRTLDSLAAIRQCDNGELRGFNRSGFVENLVDRIERLALAGHAELVDRALGLVRAYNESNAKPAITARHKFWTFGAIAAANALSLATERTSLTEDGPTVYARGEGVEVVVNVVADRVQIVYGAKPDRDTIAKLKRSGWNWSPTNGAWQRKITHAAKRSALEVTGLDSIPATESA